MGTEIKAAALAAALGRSPGERSPMRSATAGTPPADDSRQRDKPVNCRSTDRFL